MNETNQILNMMFKDYPDIVGVKELQQMLDIKRTKAYELLKSGIIKSIKIGKDYKISKFNIIAYVLNGDQVWQVT